MICPVVAWHAHAPIQIALMTNVARPARVATNMYYLLQRLKPQTFTNIHLWDAYNHNINL